MLYKCNKNEIINTHSLNKNLSRLAGHEAGTHIRTKLGVIPFMILLK